MPPPFEYEVSDEFRDNVVRTMLAIVEALKVAAITHFVYGTPFLLLRDAPRPLMLRDRS